MAITILDAQDAILSGKRKIRNWKKVFNQNWYQPIASANTAGVDKQAQNVVDFTKKLVSELDRETLDSLDVPENWR